MAELRRAERKDITREQRWDLSAIWGREQQWIKNWLPREASNRITEAHNNLGVAQEAVGAVVKGIAATYVGDDEGRDPHLLNEAHSGALAREAGSLSFLYTVRVFFWLCLLCEVGFFVVLYLLGLGNFFLVLQGILLATGAFFVGEGLYELLRPNEGEDIGGRRPGAAIRNGLFFLITGAAVVGFILWLRYDGEDKGAILAFTLALTVAVIVLTYLHKFLTNKYDNAWQKMFLCQRWIANEKHREACAEDGLWQKEYLIKLKAMNARGDQILRGTPATEGTAPTDEPGVN